MSKPRLLDLFCGAGGASVGYSRAGFEVVGMDVKRQKRYPFKFIHGDCLELKPKDLRQYDAVAASPPCQAYSVSTAACRGHGYVYPDLLPAVRDLLRDSGRPSVIENVPGAPLVDPVLLCGTMFHGLRVIRHRLFECSFPVPQPHHMAKDAHPRCWSHRPGTANYGTLDPAVDYVTVHGRNGANCGADNARAAMGIPWMAITELSEAIPPPYTEYVGRACLVFLGRDVLPQADLLTRSAQFQHVMEGF